MTTALRGVGAHVQAWLTGLNPWLVLASLALDVVLLGAAVLLWTRLRDLERFHEDLDR